MLTAEERKHVQEASIKEMVNQKGCANASHQNSEGEQTKQCSKGHNCICIQLLLTASPNLTYLPLPSSPPPPQLPLIPHPPLLFPFPAPPLISLDLFMQRGTTIPPPPMLNMMVNCLLPCLAPRN